MVATTGFLMDYSLNRVAKYLRLLGYNAVCDRQIRESELLEIAARDNLALVTSSPTLVAQVNAHNRAVRSRGTAYSMGQRKVVAYDSDGESIYSDSDCDVSEVMLYNLPHHVSKDFFLVMANFIRNAGLCYDFERVFSCCVTCNEVLFSIPKETIKNDVHEKVYEVYEAFTRCPKCHKVFWGVDGTTVVNYTSFRTLELLQRLCRLAEVPVFTPANLSSLSYFRSFPRSVHALIASFLPDNDLESLAALFPRLGELTQALHERMKFSKG
ncbi:Mut7-C RNAse domain [Trypanosoma melophagium]|uniref:Mut7-C RNAse domain n=1 Tax=Trypanosoma melophagium TaxID=715481 RepID=UPI003519EF18|nr:Mut7-C RNAse domain [Trypanosoma melophagium]